MPRNNREYLKRFADEALNDLGRAKEKLAKMGEMYGEIHPDYRDYCKKVEEMIDTTAEFLSVFRTDYI